MESKDQEDEKRIKKNKDLQALMQLRQRNAPDVSDEVSRERGEDIQIHDGALGYFGCSDALRNYDISYHMRMCTWLRITMNPLPA